MPQQQLILTIGRIERALSRLEQIADAQPSAPNGTELSKKHELLKTEARLAIRDIDKILSEGSH